jgi:hypothetical protein
MKENIGILSMQRVINYGSFLQAYALRQLLLTNGAKNVFFIDIIPGEKIIKDNFIKKIIRVIKTVLTGKLREKIQNRKFQNALKEVFEKNYFPLLNIMNSYNDSFDLVIIGSDEVFHCFQRTQWGFTLQLYGDISNAKKIVSYAASFGNTNYEMLVKYKLDIRIKKSLENLKAISVRDKNSEEIILNILGKRPLRHLDPVLIYSFKDEIANCTSKIQDYDYIVIYSYPGNISLKQEIDAITTFARENKYKIISIYSYYEWADLSVICEEPFEVFSYIKNAKYIITDTFHGSIFSIICRKQFCVLLRKYNRYKLISLLQELGLENRAVNNINSVKEKLEIEIDYIKTEGILQCERLKSNNYLSEILL